MKALIMYYEDNTEYTNWCLEIIKGYHDNDPSSKNLKTKMIDIDPKKL